MPVVLHTLLVHLACSTCCCLPDAAAPLRLPCLSAPTLQALGLEVRSVLAIGGIGGLVIGLAGREICENLLNGFLLMTTVSGPLPLCVHGCESATLPTSGCCTGLLPVPPPDHHHTTTTPCCCTDAV